MSRHGYCVPQKRKLFFCVSDFLQVNKLKSLVSVKLSKTMKKKAQSCIEKGRQ